MSRTSWRSSMGWGAVVGALVMLGGARAAAAQSAAPAPAPATPAAAPVHKEAPANSAKKKSDDEKKQAQQTAPAAPLHKVADVPPAAPLHKVADVPQAAPIPTVTAPPVAVPASVPASASVSGRSSTVISTSAPAPAAADKDDKPVYFGGVGMDISLGDTTGLYAGDEAYQNTWALEFDPSWKIGKAYFKNSAWLKKLSLKARFIMQGEFAGTGEQFRTGIVDPSVQFNGCSDAAPGAQGGVVSTADEPYCQGGSERRLDYSDITLKLSDTVYTIPYALIDVKASLGTLIPVSAESRAAGLITGIQPGVGLSRAFFNKKLTVGIGFSYAKFFSTTNTPVFESDYNPTADPHNLALGADAASQTGLDIFSTNIGGLNPSYAIQSGIDITYAPNDKFTFMGRYIIADVFKYALPECNVNLPNNPQLGAQNMCQNGDAVAAASGATTLDRGDLGTQQFWLTGDYQMNDYIDFELAFITVSPQRHPDSSWQQPFFTNDYRNYSTVNFSVTLTTEALAAKLLHKS